MEPMTPHLKAFYRVALKSGDGQRIEDFAEPNLSAKRSLLVFWRGDCSLESDGKVALESVSSSVTKSMQWMPISSHYLTF